MDITIVTGGAAATNCYILRDEGECVIIDPGANCKQIVKTILAHNNRSLSILNTHAHADHIACNKFIKEKLNARITMGRGSEDIAASYRNNASFLIGEKKITSPIDKLVNQGNTVTVGMSCGEVLELPGHCPGSIGLYFEHERYLFSGDVIFEEGIGRTDLYGGSNSELKSSIEIISRLPGSTKVYPGHEGIFILEQWLRKHYGSSEK